MAEDTRSKIKGKPRRLPPPTQPKRDDQTVVPGTGSDEQRLLGQFIIKWSSLEAVLQSLIWKFLKLGLADGRIITSKMDATTLIQTARMLGRRHLRTEYLQDFLDIMNTVDDIRESRNLATHGLWSTLHPERVATVMSLRLKIDVGVGEIASETFSQERLLELFQVTERVRAALFNLEDGILSSRDKWLLQQLPD